MGEKDKKSKKEAKVVVKTESPDYMIQPTKVTPPLDTSKWPLLLKVSIPWALVFVYVMCGIIFQSQIIAYLAI